MYGSSMGAYGGYPAAETGSKVVFVKNLNEDVVTPDILSKLFGAYGDVEKLKILWDKRSNAMIQFTSHEGVKNAMQYLQGVELFGKAMKLTEFSHGDVNVDAETKGEMSLYLGHNHPQHRFARASGPQTIGAPSEKLFIASIPLSWDEAQLRNFISPAGRVVSVKMLPPKKYQSAIVQMASVQEAINVLTMYHWALVETAVASAQGMHDLNLRVNFSASKQGSTAPQQQQQQQFHQAGRFDMAGYQQQQPKAPQYPPYGQYGAGGAYAAASQPQGSVPGQFAYQQHMQQAYPQHQSYAQQPAPPHLQQGMPPAITASTYMQQQQQQHQQPPPPAAYQGYGSFLK